jgi:ketosteroid isomerase-like protein
MAMWSTKDPVTLFGAWLTSSGWDDISHTFSWLASLRVTHVYRREDGEWKIVHRHGDRVPPDQEASAGASTKS